MSKKCWFIDLENVGWTRLEVLSRSFVAGDSVAIVYSDVCKDGAEVCKNKLKSRGFVVYLIHSSKSGSNALDFVLVAELSRMSVTHADYEYIVVSDDTGFDSFIAYMQGVKVSIKRVATPNTEEIREVRRADSKPLTEVQRHVLYDFIVTNGLNLRGGERYQHLHDICQRYCMLCDNPGEVYRVLKPILDDPKALLERKMELGFKW